MDRSNRKHSPHGRHVPDRSRICLVAVVGTYGRSPSGARRTWLRVGWPKFPSNRTLVNGWTLNSADMFGTRSDRPGPRPRILRRVSVAAAVAVSRDPISGASGATRPHLFRGFFWRTGPPLLHLSSLG